MPNPEYVRKAFTAIAPQYVATNHILSMGIDILWRKRVAEIISDWNPNNLLDVATGTGDLVLTLEKSLPDTHIVGTDFCQAMLDVAATRGLKNLICADALELPFNDKTFDVVTVAFGLRNMESYPKALQEMNRVLKPSGHIVVLDFSLPKFKILRWGYRIYLHHILPMVAGLLTSQREAYAYLGKSIEQFPQGEAMCRLLEDNGFCEANYEPLQGGIAGIYRAEK